jgi:glutamate racemase
MQNYKKIGVFATNGTINSHAYKNEIQKYNKNIEVFEKACPSWVSIVENAMQNDSKSIENIKMQLDEMMKNNVEKIILGCTHYPYLLEVLSKFEKKETFINPAKDFSKYIINDLKQNNLLNTQRTTEPKFYVSSNPKQFTISSKLFYNIENAEEVKIKTLSKI